MAVARVTLKAINDELARCGHNVRLEKSSGYFYFFGGEATDPIERTVRSNRACRASASQGRAVRLAHVPSVAKDEAGTAYCVHPA